MMLSYKRLQKKRKLKMSFETAMKRLDEISAEMEKPDITLDNSMKYYKEAVELVAFCRKYIADAKLTVLNYDEI